MYNIHLLVCFAVRELNHICIWIYSIYINLCLYTKGLKGFFFLRSILKAHFCKESKIIMIRIIIIVILDIFIAYGLSLPNFIEEFYAT